MIPIKLTLEGLYSYQQKQTIDFTKLTSNHIFGIFGTVGSGKSSILEAITFSLYGKTDRLNLSGDNRNYNMMNLKSNQLFVEFDFIAGQDDASYKVIVQAKRNSKKYNDVRTLNRTVYKKTDKDYIPITCEELEEVIGLSYDNFKRTIIIPQGRFQEFLQLGNADRTRMMKELFNLNKYELSFKVKSIENKNNANIQNLQGKLEQLGDISDEKLTELNSRYNQTEKDVTEYGAQQKQLETTLKQFEEKKDFTIKLNKACEYKTQLNEQQTEIKQLEKDIKAYESCVINFKSTLDSINLLENKVKKIEEQLTIDTKELEKNTKEFERDSAKLKVFQSEYEQIDELKRELDDISKIIEIKNAQHIIHNNQDRIKNGQEAVSSVSQTINNLEDSEKKAVKNLENLKKEMPNINELSKAKEWHHKLKQLSLNKSETKREIQAIQGEIQKLISEYKQYMIESEISYNSENTDESLNEVNLRKQKASTLLASTQEELEHLLIQSGLEQAAGTLQEGNPCPLCGSTNHPAPFNGKKTSSLIKDLKEKVKGYESELKKHDLQIQTIEKYKIGVQPLKNQFKSLNTKLIDTDKQISSLQETNETNFRTEAELNLATKKYAELNDKIATVENNFKKIRESLSKAQKDKDRYQNELNKIEKEIDKEKNAVSLLLKQVNEDIYTKYLNISTKELEPQKTTIYNRINKTEEVYIKLKTQVEQSQNNLALLKGSINANQKHLQSESKALSEQLQILEHRINNSEFSSKTEVKNILSQDLDLDTAKKKISDYNRNLLQTEKEIQVLTQQIGNEPYDSEVHEKVIKQSIEIKDKLNNSIRQQGELQSLVADMQKRLISKKEFLSKLKKLELKADDIKTLKKLFHSSGFVNYISSVYLQNLCSTANERFYKMTRQKLSLELNADNNFEVRDYMNGGNLRSIKTLSGGQTFQAALALALALADNIQSMTNTNQNFFFLDEGFGSLDKESLDIVFSTLKNLRKENRIVGVISHVEEMQQEIQTFLNICQIENTGSVIQASWEI
ncbi:hypothetical protein E9993_18005 [Labilibacter sediminis]|nr:hypothetical protein E9993_18005 [Labilibacter sediminis]